MAQQADQSEETVPVVVDPHYDTLVTQQVYGFLRHGPLEPAPPPGLPPVADPIPGLAPGQPPAPGFITLGPPDQAQVSSVTIVPKTPSSASSASSAASSGASSGAASESCSSPAKANANGKKGKLKRPAPAGGSGERARPCRKYVNVSTSTDGRDDDFIQMPMWKSYLYHLQQQAPKPKRIVCQREVANKPPYYGRDYHGSISREDADFLLTIGGEGSYLIRESLRAPGQYTLAIRFDGNTKNFKLYYDGQHYVGEKRFDTVQDLVADGLITFYLESKAADYIASLSSQSNYAESPYVAYNTYKKRQLAAPKKTESSSRPGSRPTSDPSVATANLAAGSVSGIGASEKPSASQLPPPSTSHQEARSSSSERERERERDKERDRLVPSTGVDSARRSRVNLPVEGRLSQILERERAAGAAKEAQSSAHPTPGHTPHMGVSSVTPRDHRDHKREPELKEHRHREHRHKQKHGKSSRQKGGEGSPRPHSQQRDSQVSSQSPSRASTSVIDVSQATTATSHQQVSAQLSSSSTSSSGSTSSVHHYQNAPPAPAPRHSKRFSQHQPLKDTAEDGEEAEAVPERPREVMADMPKERAPDKPADKTGMRPSGSEDASKVHQSQVASSGVPVIPAVDDLDGKVSSATNTDGPKISSNSLPSPSTRRSPSPRAQIRNSKKAHNFKMLEEVHFSTPPSSPPPGLHVPPEWAMGMQNFKLSSVSWCTDYLEVMGCEKPHNFKLHTFKGPHWCDFCANFLWGLIAQGVKCQDCGLNAHKKCSEKVPNDCMPDMKYVKRMFGIDLTTLVKARNTLIPMVVEICVKEIEKRGVESEGLYRVAGFHDDVEAIKMSFDKDGEMTDITEESYDDINTITSLLKLYFRLLPIPLITFDIYFKVIDTVRRDDINMDVKMEKLKHMLAQLPPAHYHTLKYLIAHLHRVTEHQQQNMMSSENLAIVFAPTLLRSPETDPLTSLTAVKYERELIELMIIHQNVLFKEFEK